MAVTVGVKNVAKIGEIPAMIIAWYVAVAGTTVKFADTGAIPATIIACAVILGIVNVEAIGATPAVSIWMYVAVTEGNTKDMPTGTTVAFNSAVAETAGTVKSVMTGETPAVPPPPAGAKTAITWPQSGVPAYPLSFQLIS